jgi:hypothetical protein
MNEIYDERVLNDYFNTRDYLGAANYLKQFQANSPKNAEILRRKINNLERQGEIQNAILEKAETQEQKDAYHFISAIDGQGNIPHTIYNSNTKEPIVGTSNIFGDKYTSLINNLKSDKGKQIQTLKYTIYQDDTLYSLYDALGLTENEAKQKYNFDVVKDSKTGYSTLYIDTNNTSLPKILSAMPNRVNTTPFYSASGLNYDITSYNYELSGLDKEGNDESVYNQVYKISALCKQATNTMNNLLDVASNKTFVEDTVVTPFLGAGQAKAYEDLGKGLLTQEQYNNIVKERTNAYNTLLRQTGLSQYKVYASEMTDDESEVMKELDNNSRKNIMKNILYAMDNDRITYSAAIVGGETGTYITISPKADKDGEFDDGEANKGYRIFVPGLFKSSCDASFESRTELQSVRDYNDMKRWEYAKNLQDGDRVGYDKTIGPYKVVSDNTGNLLKLPIEEKEMLVKLNKDNIIKQSAQMILSNIGDDGKLKVNNGYTTIESMAAMLAQAAIMELNETVKYDDLDYAGEQNDIYRRIIEYVQSNINTTIN